MTRLAQLTGTSPYAWPLSGNWSVRDTAVVTIDMQRDFLAADGYFGALGESNGHLTSAIGPAQNFLQRVRLYSLLMIHTRESHRPELVDLNDNKRQKAMRMGSPIGSQGPMGRLLVRGERGCDFHDGFQPLSGEIVVDKPGNSAFYATDLEHILRARHIRNLILLGVTTDVCVSSTMRDANDRGFDCVLLEDCCGAATQALHDAVVASIQREGGIFGSCGKSADVLEVLASAQAASPP
ncbi:cysteine hydrolase family protein [Phytopseudomonas daroniae]|uniref:cysteine hydrolase family protein n=1 Tax=Phytopseudomonas daroniae TaxID=2487519 RepID=UPI00103832A9|nr:isochorismatase family cysteine hydrolase [Pseudomonas daroniae]TBU75945.1 cysteine hydrolase [Pseudomonas daroniae]